MSQPPDDSSNPFASPQQAGAAPLPAHGEGDATGGVIPYKNAPALLAYYFGIFALVPCVGIFMAIPAFILGIIGLRQRRRNPAIKGAVHAWFGIVLGALCTVLWGALIALMIAGLTVSRQP